MRTRTSETFFQEMSDFEFVRTFRLRKEAVRHLTQLLGTLYWIPDFHFLIIDCLENELISEAKSGRPLSPHDIVCLGLNMMAGGHFQRIGAIVRGLSQSSVCRALNR